jgi:Protein of unknown function (DUF2946)
MTIARRRNSHALHRLAAVLGVMAVLLRCVIAPGLMPDLAAAAEGSLKLVICTGAGAKFLPVTRDDGSAPSGHRADDGVCPYAAFGHLATPVELAGLNIADFDSPAAAPIQQRSPPASRIGTPGARAPPPIARSGRPRA